MVHIPQHSSASIPSHYILQDCEWRVRDRCLTNLSQRNVKRFKNVHVKWRLNVVMQVQHKGSGNGTPLDDGGVYKCRPRHVVSVKWHEWNCTNRPGRPHSTGIVAILQTERSGIRFPAGRRDCNPPCPDRFCSDGYWGLLSGGKAVEVPPSSAAANNEWSLPPDRYSVVVPCLFVSSGMSGSAVCCRFGS
jgi:hypothetical protein